MKILLILLLCSFGVLAQDISLVPYASGFQQPMLIAENGTDSLFIVENAGKVKVIDSVGIVASVPFLDLSGKFNSPYLGMMGLAFHPDFKSNGYFYVRYNDQVSETNYLSRFKVSLTNPKIGDPASEQILLSFPGFTGHMGGNIAFGKDGYLYIVTGDGARGTRGDQGDEATFARNMSSLKGKVLRLDVDLPSPYIPAENPYQGPNDTIPDILIATGLRNPWRFSFDRSTGDIWIGDAGQDSFEEVDFVPYGAIDSKDFGWSCYEGNYLLAPNNCGNLGDYVPPIHTYAGYNLNGQQSSCVIGGYVYRGKAFPFLHGYYIFADFNSGDIRSFYQGQAMNHGNLISTPVTFGENKDGELFVASYATGQIFKLNATCAVQMGITGSRAISESIIVSETIQSNAHYTTGLEVLYKAGHMIELNPGFKIDQNIVFKAEIGPCQN